MSLEITRDGVSKAKFVRAKVVDKLGLPEECVARSNQTHFLRGMDIFWNKKFYYHIFSKGHVDVQKVKWFCWPGTKWYFFFVENSDKFKNIVHQRDVWHGGKGICKKLNTVSTTFSKHHHNNFSISVLIFFCYSHMGWFSMLLLLCQVTSCVSVIISLIWLIFNFSYRPHRLKETRIWDCGSVQWEITFGTVPDAVMEMFLTWR